MEKRCLIVIEKGEVMENVIKFLNTLYLKCKLVDYSRQHEFLY